MTDANTKTYGNEDSILIQNGSTKAYELVSISEDTSRIDIPPEVINTVPIKKVKTKKPNLYIRLFTFTRKEIRNIIIANVSLVITSAGQTAIPYLCGEVLDTINESKSEDIMNNLCFWFLLLIISNAVFMFIKAYLSSITGEKIICELRSEMFHTLMEKDLEFYEQRKSGELLSRLSSDTTLIQSASNNKVSQTVKSLVQLIGSFGLLFSISFKLTSFFIVILPFIIVFVNRYSRFLKKISKKYQAQIAECTVVATEAIYNIRVVKSFSSEDKEERFYRDKMEVAFNIGKRKALWNGFFNSIVGFLGNGAILFVLWYGGRLVFDGELTPGQLASFVLYTITIAMAAMNLSYTVNKMVSATAACERVFEIFDHKPKINYKGGEVLENNSWEIEFKNVDFKYPSKENILVFKNLNLKIAPGEKVAIVGASGSGKSSLVCLLERFYDVTNGQININGVNIKAIDLRCLHSNIGYVSQEPLLFSGSIEENITYGCGSYSPESLDDVLKQANAYEFIYDKVMFPSGLKTVVGEKGVRLSGGQKQRIAIARAIMINPKVLIFDEATSALDAESEAQVQKAIDNLTQKEQMTLIIIAHRLSTVVNCPRIMVMQHGRVVEEGNHRDLITREGPYKLLITRQIQGLMVADEVVADVVVVEDKESR